MGIIDAIRSAQLVDDTLEDVTMVKKPAQIDATNEAKEEPKMTSETSASAPASNVTGFAIDDAVPLPEKAPKYPWEALAKPGQSFFVPGGKLNTFNTHCTRYGKKLSIKLICRAVTEKGVEGVRVWRTE